MSHVPPPPPAGPSPGGPPPGEPDGPAGYPPYPLAQHGLSGTVKIVLGAVIGAAALPVVGFLGLLVGSRVDVFAFVWLAPLLVLLAGIGLLVDQRTRFWGTGVLIGFFGMLIVGAGACALLIVGLTSGGV